MRSLRSHTSPHLSRRGLTQALGLKHNDSRQRATQITTDCRCSCGLALHGLRALVTRQNLALRQRPSYFSSEHRRLGDRNRPLCLRFKIALRGSQLGPLACCRPGRLLRGPIANLQTGASKRFPAWDLPHSVCPAGSRIRTYVHSRGAHLVSGLTTRSSRARFAVSAEALGLCLCRSPLSGPA